MIKESRYRSILKTLAWRLVVLFLDFSIALLLIGDFELATSFAIIKFILATSAYYIHERIWNRINWGRG
jgi:uncharacterized membrane protein